MGRKTIINFAWATLSLLFFGVLMSKLSDTGVQLPTPMSRPDYVPESAVQRISSRLWFDCAPAADKQTNHFDITVYNGDEAQVKRQQGLLAHPEIVGDGAFALSGPARTVKELRHLIQTYDGEIIYLRNGEILEPVYSMSSR